MPCHAGVLACSCPCHAGMLACSYHTGMPMPSWHVLHNHIIKARICGSVFGRGGRHGSHPGSSGERCNWEGAGSCLPDCCELFHVQATEQRRENATGQRQSPERTHVRIRFLCSCSFSLTSLSYCGISIPRQQPFALCPSGYERGRALTANIVLHTHNADSRTRL